MANPAIQVDGLKELRRDLKKLGKEAQKELRVALKAGAEMAVPAAQSLAPKRSWELAGSIKSGTSGAKAFIGSKLPYAAVHQWGGRVGRNKSVQIQPKHYLTKAVEETAPRIMDHIEDEIGNLARRLGW